MGISLKSRAGEKSGPFVEEVSEERIRRFSDAVGALATHEASPTFMTVCRKGEFKLFQDLGVELSRVLHAEQEYEYQNLIFPGDLLRCETTLSQVIEKSGASGSLHFLTFVTEVDASRKTEIVPIGTSKTTIVLREPKQEG